MIKLQTEYYCHDCPYFKCMSKTEFDVPTQEFITYIKCEDQYKCADLYKRFVAIDKAASINPDFCE